MKLKYANPYFKNEKMHEKLLKFLNKRKPKLSPNLNINNFEADSVAVPNDLALS